MTSSLLTYLMTIDSLSSESGSARSVDVADRLNVARASVSKAADRLTDGGWAVRDDNGRLRLTERGREAVRAYAPARDVLVAVFTGRLGLTAARAERDALAVLGALDEDTVIRIARLYTGAEERK